MIKVVGYFKNKTVSQVFNNVLDAIEFRDDLDAQYARVEWINL